MSVRLNIKEFVRKVLEKKNKNWFDRSVLFLVSLAPPLRALTLAKRGEITRPMRLLLWGGQWFSESRALKKRLADMVSFIDGRKPLPGTEQAVHLAPFNGRVLCAFHSCGYYDPSGYTSRSVALASRIRGQGVDLFAAVRPGYPWDLAKHRSKKNVELQSYQGIQFRFFPESSETLHSPESEYIENYATVLSRYAKEKNVSVVHAASNYLNGSAAAIAGRELGVPSIYELRGLWHITRAFYDPSYGNSEHYDYVERREIEACNAVNQVVTLSEAMANWLIERGVSSQKIRVVGNAAFPPERNAFEDRNDVRKRFGIPSIARVIGYLGSIVEYEGLDSLIQALGRTDYSKRPYLLIVGSGKHEPQLKRLVSVLNLDEHVVFAGRAAPEEVSSFYYAMDCVALPRKNHVLTRLVPAIKPFEVLAHQRPVFLSPPLAEALGKTFPKDGYSIVDFDQISNLSELVDSVHLHMEDLSVPSWEDRAAELVEIYRLAGQCQEGD